MYGLVLEGGGAKGSYHIGVYKALMEEGVEIKGVVGTSIGALNGAMIVQGDYDKCYELWSKITYSMVVDVNDEEIERIIQLKLGREDLRFIKEKIKELIGYKGFDITPLKRLLDEYIDEEKIRNSGMDFGMVTINLSEFKPLYMYIEDIPKGELTQYLLASAYLPFFKAEKLGGKRYLDGGFYDNLPYRMLLNKGYKDIILIRTHAKGITRRLYLPNTNSILISPSGDIGKSIEYDSTRSRLNIKMGYYDGLRAIRGLRGQRYYVIPKDNKDYYLEFLLRIKEEDIRKLQKILKLPQAPYRRSLFEDIIPRICSLLSIDKDYDYEDILIYLLEKKAEKCKIERFKIYTFEDLLSQVIDKRIPCNREARSINRLIEKVEILPIFNKDETILEVANVIFSSDNCT
ncbi:MAG: patatin-like phospholipase family protein [Tissierellia bacterium]|nr:patatin-like phospholipase family protein [Tissierellia bacterium]